MDRVLEPEVDGRDVRELTQRGFEPPCGFIAVTDVVCDILGKLKLNHVKLGIRITGEHAGARRSVHRFFHALRTLAVMMAVDGAAPGLRANLVELVTERAHFGGVVLIARDNFVNGIDDDSVKVLIPYTADEFRNHNVEITSRMSSYKIPEKLNQLETTCASKDCLDTAIATNMIAVGMDVDRLGLMVVTGQPKQNSEYIQATSRIGRAFPGLVVTLYNAYRPRDLSHYENFTGYHSQLYRFVEGTTATPFSARARDRVMHALIISAIRLNFPNMANNPDAAAIGSLTTEQLDSVKKLIIDRLNIIKPSARADAEEEIDRFIDWWKLQAAQTKPLRYYVVGTERYNRLMNPYDQPHDENEKATLRSMREVESSANMFYYTED